MSGRSRRTLPVSDCSFYGPWIISGSHPIVSLICFRELTYYINVDIPLDHPQRTSLPHTLAGPVVWHVQLINRRAADRFKPYFCELDCVLIRVTPLDRVNGSHVVIHYSPFAQSPAAKRSHCFNSDDDPEHKRFAIRSIRLKE
ncbi:p17 [Pteropine orthoreovirus]|uniref:p17 n=2 Tax=Reovirales TaxID=2732541 RepID=G4XG13_9REOV|nr:P17 [Orthoreovirus HK46886/09]BAJ52807.1 P17 [Reovirus sp. miyazaki]BAT21546.1 p17 [Pteropine orthoreovirus]